MSPKTAVFHGAHLPVYEKCRASAASTESCGGRGALRAWCRASRARPVLRILSFCAALGGCANHAAQSGGAGPNPGIASGAGESFRSGDQPRAWNELLLSMAKAEDGFLTLKGLRATTMMHLAAHDALSAIRSRFAAYAHEGDADDADPDAAVAQASYDVAASLFTTPEQLEKLEAERDRWLSLARDDASRREGIELGHAAARTILGEREGDGWNDPVQYAWQPMGPGVYAEFHEHSGTPEGFVFGAGWARARPFALDSPSQFRVPPPPEIGSAEYARAFAQVKELGRDESATRTKDQTHQAYWWKDFCENSLNRLGRQITAREALDLWQTTRFFALINMSLYDGYVSVFDNKFHYNHWRPYTAIRWAANDANEDTLPDPHWDNTHHHTYAFPSYPSAHGTACAAMFAVYESFFGDDYEFSMTTEEVNRGGPSSPMMKMEPPTRSFGSFDEAAMECAMSRVYLGIHFEYDSIEGNALGKKVGEHVLAHFLTVNDP